MAIATRASVTDQDVRSVSATQGGASLGQLVATADGRTYAYGLNGSASTALSPGKLAQGATTTANHVNRTGVTAVAGTQQVAFTVGSTAVTAGQYQQGYLVVNAGTGAGQALEIASHNTVGSSGGTITVNLADAVITATASSDSKFTLQPHPYSNGLIAAHGSSTSLIAIGVPNVSIPAANYGWFQVGGAASVLANGTPGVGVWVIPSATTDGAVDVYTNAATQPAVGYCLMTAVSTEYRSVFLNINVS